MHLTDFKMEEKKKFFEKVDKILDEAVEYISEKYSELKPLEIPKTKYAFVFGCKEKVDNDGILVQLYFTSVPRK